MNRLLKAGVSCVLALSCTVSAFALQVPDSTVVQNLNGVQQYVKTYTVPIETDPQELIEAPFEYEGFVYTYADITKEELTFAAQKEHTATITVETKKKDLAAVLDVLEPTMEYDDGRYAGTLALDHTTIRTEPAGYTSGSYTVRETKEIGSLDSNDMSYVPATTVKDGRTLSLESVDWQVQSTALVDDVLVPSRYVAVATYAGKASYSTPTGYITTADYTGTIACNEVTHVTYTVLYVGKEGTLDNDDVVPVTSRAGLGEHFAVNKTAYIIGGAVVAALLVGAFVLLRIIKKDEEQEVKEEEPDEDES